MKGNFGYWPAVREIVEKECVSMPCGDHTVESLDVKIVHRV